MGLDSTIALTGASGFVGRALLQRLAASDQVSVRAFYRSVPAASHEDAVQWDLLESIEELIPKLRGIDAVVHTAALVHQMGARARPSEEEYLRANATATETLARASAAAGVRRFVFLSTIKVNGERTESGFPFRATDAPHPADAYARSKLAAERSLRTVGEETGLETVSLRIPLVYGPDVRANFRTMMNWIGRGIPLPLGAIDNRRSLLALDNLVDLIATCIDHQHAANQTFVAADAESVSTTELLERIAAAMGRPSRLIPAPPAVLRAAALTIGRSSVARRLCDSLEIDASATFERLSWRPPVTLSEALRAAVADFR